MSVRALIAQTQAAPPIPINEAERLSALHRIGILDTGRDASFDRLTRLAASIFATRYSFVSFVDRSRQWFKSAQGTDVVEMPRESAFCAYTILGTDIMVVNDALKDDRFRNNPIVQGGLKLRFYAGVPLITADGHHVGSFCIADTSPRHSFSDADKLTLATLAEMASEIVREFRFALVSLAAQDGVWDWDVLRQEVYYSPQWQSLVGLKLKNEMSTLEDWTERIHPADRRMVLEDLEQQLRGHTMPFRSEHRVKSADGAWRWVLVRGVSQRDEQGRVIRMAGSLMQVAQDKTSDALTRLPNRLSLHDRLSRVIRRSQASDQWDFAVLFVDVDRFKQINDRYGLTVGDEVLITIADRISSVIERTRRNRESMVTRFGGDEFVVLVDGVHNARQAEAVAKRIQAAISTEIELHGERLRPEVSIGIAMASSALTTPESFLHNADLAMFHAKTSGRKASTVFDLRMQEENLKRLKMEEMLRQAVAQGQMRLFYQPQIDLKTGKLSGCEALVRWQHPELGLVPPDSFIPLAERMGIIGEIDTWVLETAAAQIALWRAEWPQSLSWHMSVNVSAEKFPSKLLLKNVSQTLARHSLPASVLCMEITETALMRHVADSQRTMEALRTIGIGLHMDDFGSGYSSFKQLCELPFDTLKIDRSFLQRILGNEQAINIVRGILSLARSLKLSSIAEGIETVEQEELLRSLGCDRGQGYLYSKPVDAQTFTARYLAVQAVG